MLAWAPSVDCSKSCHARSTSRRIGYEGNLWPAERDLQDPCRQPCSNSTGYSEVSIRAGHLPQQEFCLPESNEAKSETKVDETRDAERFRVQRGIGYQIRECVQDYSKKLGDPKAAVPTDPWFSGTRTLALTEGQLTGDVICLVQKTSTCTPSSKNQLAVHSNSRDSFERCKSLRTSPSTTADLTVVAHAGTKGGVEAAVTRSLRTGEEASDHRNRAPSLKKVSQLAERGTAPHNLVAEGLDDSESTRSSRGGSQKERSNTWTENVELVRSGPIFFRNNVVECSTDTDLGEREGFGFHNVIDSQASHGKAKDPRAESANPNQKLHHSKVQSQDKPQTANAISESPQSQVLTELASREATCDALGIESFPQSSGGDQPQQGSIPAQIERGLKNSCTRSDSERKVEEIATKGRRYPERVGNLGPSKGPATGRQTNSDRPGDKSQDTVGTAGVHTIPERIGGTAEGQAVHEISVEVSESHSAGERLGGTADGYSGQEGTGGSSDSFTIRERTGGSPSEGTKIPERIGAGSDRDSAGKVLEKGKEEKLHPREEGHQRQSESSEERRIRARVDGSSGAASGGGDETEEPKVVRPARPSGGKDRHSKVNTAKGPRDRRVRLSVPTAMQFYDVQDRLGFDQPSKAVEWLIHKAKDAIDELGRIPVDGKEGPRVQGVCGSDISHHVPTPYNAAVSGLLSGSSACTPATSFQGSSSNPYGDQLSFFLDPSLAQGMFAPLQPNQGNFASPTFGLGRIDLTRGNSGSTEGGRSSESTGSPLARVESRTKARERARERTKKGPGRDGSQGKLTGGGSPSSSQSPPFHSNPTFTSFNASSSMQGSVHNLSLQSPHQTPILSGVYDGPPFSRIMQGSHQAVPFQNLIMHNPTLDSQFNDQIQSPLQNTFLVQPQGTLQSTMNTLQQPHLQTMQVNAQGALHLGSPFNPGPSSSSFAEASLSSSHYPPVSTLPLTQSLSVLGMSPATSLGPHYPTGSPTPIPSGFSPGPPASPYRGHSLSISQCSNQNQHQGVSRVQRPVPSFSAAPSISISQAGSSSSRASTHPYFLGTSPSTVMGCLQSIPSERLNSPSFVPRSNVGYDHGARPRSLMSPRMNPYQASNSQIPARIQGLDDMEELEEELNSATPSSPHP